VRLAVGRADSGEGPHWRAGGVLIQNIAEDQRRGSTAEAWTTAQALFETIAEDELVDPTTPAETLLWRLFNEAGVRLFAPTPVRAFCRCSPERIAEVLDAFPAAERAAMVGADGRIQVTCEYCARTYEVEAEAAV
jgi:molecular chaperone Hsp33